MMKRLFVLFLIILLLAVPAYAEGYLVCDGSGLLTEEEVLKLEEIYSQYQDSHGFTPVFVTTDSFEGLSSREYAWNHHYSQGYPEDRILMLVSLEEGQWYITADGVCHNRISQDDITMISKAVLRPLGNGDYYEAVAKFVEVSAQCFEEVDNSTDAAILSDDVTDSVNTDTAPKKNYVKTSVISVVVGMLIGLIAVGIMAAPMKSVKMKQAAADYIRPGSMTITGCRDIYLYSRVRRSAKPKSSNGSHGSSKHSGAGGRI